MTGDGPCLSAPYGHACSNCVRAKSKCIIRHAGGPCQRCHRKNKECRPGETIRRRNPRKPAGSKAASIRLEEKLDSLVSLIKSGKEMSIATPSQQSLPDGTILMKGDSHTMTPVRMTTTDPTSSSHSVSYFTTGDGDEPSSVEAEEYLQNFQNHKSKYFPFVYIPSTTTAKQLGQERPFLWLSIMIAGSKSTSQQQALGGRMRQRIAQEMVVRSEKNIELLLALLIFIGWSHYQIHNKPFLATFTHLATSLVFDLGLNKPIKDANVNFSLCQKPSTPRTMEERRAVLGCFLVTSIMSLVSQRIDALRWTTHMDECLQILDHAKECPNDEILVQQVRLQLLVEKLALSTSLNGAMENIENTEPASLYLEDLHAQFQSLKAGILSASSRSEVVLLHLHSTELEIAFLPTLRRANPSSVQQRQFSNASLELVKSWFDVFCTITPAAYIGFSFPIFLQVARCLTILYWLTSLKDPIWDKDGASKIADVILISNRVISNMEQVAAIHGLDNNGSPDGDIFTRSAQMIRSFRAEWEAKQGTEESVLPSTSTPHISNEVPFPDTIAAESFDNDWLMDLVNFPELLSNL